VPGSKPEMELKNPKDEIALESCRLHALRREAVLDTPEERELVKALLDWPALVAGAAEALEPHRIKYKRFARA